MKPRELLYNIGYDDEKYFLNHDLDDAIIGVSTNDNIIYDYENIVKILMKKENLDTIDADELANNIIRSLPYGNENAPIIIYPILKI